MTEPYSVLMTVHGSCDAAQFDAALRSMTNQTLPPSDTVIVCDGSPSDALRAVLSDYQSALGAHLQILQTEKCRGIGIATALGLTACKYDLVAKMDSDDISVPTRCEKQVQRFSQNPMLIVLGGFIEEFDSDPTKPDTIRCVPCADEEIRRFARRRQPFNNMTVMYRKSAVMQVGGYRPFRRNEDYDLYVRLLHHGYFAENLPEILVRARVDRRAYSRRGSFQTLIGTIRSRFYAFRIGFSSFSDFLFCLFGAIFLFVVPSGLRKWLYLKFLRSRTKS